MKTYSYSNSAWDFILPDGPQFCHWGGRGLSHKVIGLLDLNSEDKVCDLCCGEAGTLALIGTLDIEGIELYGIDTSYLALNKAKNGLNGNFRFVQGDVLKMPFKDESFNKLFSQDPDVLLYPNKDKVVAEISRVSQNGAIFVLQTYAITSLLNEKIKENTSHMLSDLGYYYTEPPNIRLLLTNLKENGYEVQLMESLHEVYKYDNLRMIQRLQDNKIARKIKGLDSLEQFLKMERYLFQENIWTGILIKAIKV